MRFTLGLSRDNSRIFWAVSLSEGTYNMWSAFWPLYLAALGASPLQIGLLTGLRGLLGLLAILPSGRLSDRFRTRDLLVSGWGMMTAGFAGYGLAQSWPQALPSLVLRASARFAFPTVNSAIAQDADGEAALARAFSLIWSVGPSTASLVVPALGSLIAARLGLHAVALCAAFCTAICTAIFATLSPARAPARTRGSTVSYRAALAQRPVLLVNLLTLATSIELGPAFTLLPNFLSAQRGVPLGAFGALIAVASLGSIVLGLLVNRVRALQRPLATFRLSLALVAAALALFLWGRGLAWFAVAYLLRGAALVAEVQLGVALGSAAAPELRSRAFAIQELVSAAAYSLAPILAGVLYGRDPRLPLIVALAAIAPLIAVAGLGGSQRDSAGSAR